MSVMSIFAPDHARYEGVRPVQIWGLRVFYFLMAAFVATDAWGALLRHEGPWDNMRAIALCVWATYPTLAILGLVNPLRMLPIMFFTIGYKSLFLIFVSYPLWATGTLAGSGAEQMTNIFLWMPALLVLIPWKYAYRTYVLPARTSTQVDQRGVNAYGMREGRA